MLYMEYYSRHSIAKAKPEDIEAAAEAEGALYTPSRGNAYYIDNCVPQKKRGACGARVTCALRGCTLRP